MQQNTRGYNTENQKYRIQGRNMKRHFQLQQGNGTYRRQYQTPTETYKKRHPNKPRLKMGRYISMQGEMIEAMEKITLLCREQKYT